MSARPCLSREIRVVVEDCHDWIGLLPVCCHVGEYMGQMIMIYEVISLQTGVSYS